MTPEERSALGKRAAQSRWSTPVKKVVSGSPDRPLQIGDVEIECYVLDTGERVLTQASFLQALGRHRNANVKRGGDVPPILEARGLNAFITDEILEKARPIMFRPPKGGRASGYNAELLPVVCELYLKARDAGLLLSHQAHVADRADVLIRALAHVGIIALVDEATGYQELRARDALARILEAFVEKELQPWVQTFPDDYYRQMFRLRQLDYPTGTVKRPQYFGMLTNNIVYKRLAPGVLEELRRVTERNEQGRPKHKYFQHLTDNVGYPKLREHLASVVTIMKLSRDWPDFMIKLDQIHPATGDVLMLPFEPGDSGL